MKRRLFLKSAISTTDYSPVARDGRLTLAEQLTALTY